MYYAGNWRKQNIRLGLEKKTVLYTHSLTAALWHCLLCRKLKEARKRQQEENVNKKAAAHEENKQRSLAGIQRKQEEEQEADSNVEEPETSKT